MTLTVNQPQTRGRLAELALGGPALTVAAVAVSILVWWLTAGLFTFPESLSVDFASAINAGEDWLKGSIRGATRAIAAQVSGFIETVELFLWFLPWPIPVVAIGLMSLRYGGLRFALFSMLAVMFWGMVDMWDAAMSTLALMGVSVLISVIIGLPLGVWCAQSDRVQAVVNPILDTMQTMPAFVYLLPALFFFGVGETGAAMAIVIYAMPPVVRLTNLGIRQVPAASVEVARSFGASRWQRLWQVQVPQAMPSIILGINQTIMMALGLAVLAVFIGSGGLGREVYSALTRLKVGWAFEAGMCIVFMAIVCDRLTLAMSRPRTAAAPGLRFRLFPQAWAGFAPVRTAEIGIARLWQAADTGSAALTGAAARALPGAWGETLRGAQFLFVSALILIAIWAWNAWIARIGFFPSSLQFSMREPVDAFVDWLAVDPVFVAFSKGLRAVIYLYLLNPLDQFLVGLPWFYILGALFLMAWATGGPVFASVVTALMFLTGVAGIWVPTMETMSSTIASVAICVLIGLPVGVIAAYNRTVDSIVRPILDTMQTMPAFVYLIPVLMLFGGNKVTAVIATVIYAIPPVVRLTTLGLRQLPPEISEVSQSFGATELQALVRVKLPMALPSLMLGVNQAIIMALAMQVITPMVAGEGLGKIVFGAMTLADTGTGLVAGTGIVLLAIVLDRLTQAWSAKQRKALGL